MNILVLKDIDSSLLWEIIKKIKVDFSSSSNSVSCENTGPDDETFVHIQHLRSLLTSIEEYLSVASNVTIQENVQENTLESAGEMFIYLLTCPKPKLGWIQFYENLMENFPPNIIVLELNRLLHSKKNSHSIEKKVLYLVRKKLNIFDNNIKLFSENLDAKGTF